MVMTSTQHHAMVRMQVYFTEQQHRALRQAARREGISMSALLRRRVERELVGKPATPNYSKDALTAFIGLGRSGRSDASENHDEALAEALREDTDR